MRNLLSKNEKKLLEVIEMIEENKIYTFKYLEEQLNINTRTLNGLIETFNINYFPLKIFKNDSGQIIIQDKYNFSIKYIYAKTLSMSTEFNILEWLFFRSLSLDQLTEKAHMSPSTLRRTIKRMNSILIKEGFYIESSPFRIVGNEKSICNFIVHYIIEKYEDETLFFKKRDLSFANQLLEITTRLKNISLTHTDRQRVIIWVLTALKRSEQRKPTSNKTISDEENIFILLKKMFKIEIQNNEYIQVLNSIFQERINIDYQSLLENSKKDRNISVKLTVVEKILKSVCEIFRIPPPTSKKKLIEHLYFITEIQFGKSYVLFNKDYIFYKRMVAEVSPKFKLLHEAIKCAFSESEIPLEEHQILSYLYNMIINWDDFLYQIINSKKKISIGIFFRTDFKYAEIVKEFINYKLPDMFDIEILANPKKAKNVELIITDYSSFESKINVYSLVGFPSINDLDWLVKFYRERV